MERLKAILVLTAAMGFALSPLMVTGFNGFEPDQFPIPQTDPPAQPAGWAFSIWLVIYLWLIAGCGYGLLNRADHREWDAHRWPLIASLVIGTAWLPVAQMSPVWATVMIWAMLATAIRALLASGRDDRMWRQAPIALYAGWLTAASCVALALLLAGYGVMGAQAAALTVLVLALVLASGVMALRPGTPEYALAVIWALSGVAVSNAAPVNAPVLGLCVAGIAGLGWMALKPAR